MLTRFQQLELWLSDFFHQEINEPNQSPQFSGSNFCQGGCFVPSCLHALYKVVTCHEGKQGPVQFPNKY
jgi:hypothetical protein